MKPLLAFLAAYSALLAILLPRLTLWVDEVLTLLGAMQPDLASLVAYVKTVPGGTPLAFLVPHVSIAALGYSAFSGRLPSALASIAACPAVFLLARRIGMRTPLLAVAVFALYPLQFRYALEARPYALALCLSVWMTVVFLSLLDRPSPLRATLYALLTAAAGLTLAYALFVPLAHLAWLLYTRQHRQAAVAILAALAAAGCALLPWYAYFRADWSAVTQREGLAVWDWSWTGVLLKELTGAGYAGTALLLAGAAAGLRLARPRALWIAYAAVPLLLVLAGNFAFGYFFAIRQAIYAIVPLVLLFALGSEARWGKVLLGAFLAASLYEDVNWFRKPREDFPSAAAAIPPATCVRFIPQDVGVTFRFFRPELGLAESSCPPEPDRVVLAISPYNADQPLEEARRELAARGLARVSEQSFDGPAIEVYVSGPR